MLTDVELLAQPWVEGPVESLAARLAKHWCDTGVSMNAERLFQEIDMVKRALEKRDRQNAASAALASSDTLNEDVVFSIDGSLMIRGKAKARASGKRGKGLSY